MSLRLALPVAALFTTTLFAACSSDDDKPAAEHGDHDHDAGPTGSGGSATGSGGSATGSGGSATGSGGSATGSGGSATNPDFDCKAKKWSTVSDSCWSCMCDACAAKLNACETDCMKGIECAFEKHTLVNVASEIQCEISATGAECLQGVALDKVKALIDFDTCLILAPKDSGFRKCDAECDIPYSGDVCDRYPPPPKADAGN